jgi:hypothetical protein
MTVIIHIKLPVTPNSIGTIRSFSATGLDLPHTVVGRRQVSSVWMKPATLTCFGSL